MSIASVNRRRILSIWLPRLPTDRIKRRMLRHGGQGTHPLIVVARQNNALHICALDDEAARLGLAIGLPLANARVVCPDIAVEDADDMADQAALISIADWCDRFTPLVGLNPPCGLLLDITGCAHLFGGEETLLKTVCAALAAQGFTLRAAIAGTAACAKALSRVTHGRVVRPGEEALAVGTLPVAALGADAAITKGLRRAGLKTIGEVAARSTHEIAARFGADFTSLLAQALGQSDAPISPRKPAPDYIAEKKFAEPIATSDAIATTLASLAQMLIAAMERHGKGARRMDASFFRTDGAVRTITVETGHPVAEAGTLNRLFDEKLDALSDPLDPGFGFDLIRLSASRTVDVAPTQRDFDTHRHEAGDVSRLIDRLAARLGPQRVVRYLPADTHIPERASAAVPAQHHMASALVWPARTLQEPPLRPLLMFDTPQWIEVVAQFPHGPPAGFRWRRSFRRLARIEGPERIAMEWWRRSEPRHQETDQAFERRHAPQDAVAVETVDASVMTRDYFRAEDAHGIRYWIYREGIYMREVETFRWFLHGLFA